MFKKALLHSLLTVLISLNLWGPEAQAQSVEYFNPLVICKPFKVESTTFKITILTTDLETKSALATIVDADGDVYNVITGTFEEKSDKIVFTAKTKFTNLRVEFNRMESTESSIKFQEKSYSGKKWDVVFEGKNECSQPQQEESIGAHN